MICRIIFVELPLACAIIRVSGARAPGLGLSFICSVPSAAPAEGVVSRGLGRRTVHATHAPAAVPLSWSVAGWSHSSACPTVSAEARRPTGQPRTARPSESATESSSLWVARCRCRGHFCGHRPGMRRGPGPRGGKLFSSNTYLEHTARLSHRNGKVTFFSQNNHFGPTLLPILLESGS